VTNFDSRPKVIFSRTLSGPHPTRAPLRAVIDVMLCDTRAAVIKAVSYIGNNARTFSWRLPAADPMPFKASTADRFWPEKFKNAVFQAELTDTLAAVLFSLYPIVRTDNKQINEWRDNGCCG
jgi:hypothetical protein